MREILFRGKTEDGEWRCGGVLQNEGYSAIIEYSDYHHWHKFVEVIPETVGQYTGLTDKNGKKIFEGDYWIDTDDDYVVLVVEFRNGQFGFVSYGWCGALMPYGYDENAGGFGELDYEPMDNYIIDNIEIIGNIHDNPELLKGE